MTLYLLWPYSVWLYSLWQVTAAFPGPSVYAKTARGQLARFCAAGCVTSVAQLREFRGSAGKCDLTLTSLWPLLTVALPTMVALAILTHTY